MLVALIPLITLGSTSYFKSSELVQVEFGNYGRSTIRQLKLQMDTNLKQMNFIADNILTYLIPPALSKLSDHKPQSYNELVEQNNFLKFLGSHISPNIIGAFVITSSGYYYGSNEYLISGKLTEWPEWKRAHDEERLWVGFHPPQYYNTFFQPSINENKVISLIIPIRKDYSIQSGSKILIDMDAGELVQLFHSFEKDTRSHLVIRSPGGDIIYETSDNFTPQTNDVVWKDILHTNGWIIEARVPAAVFQSTSKAIWKYTLIFILLSVVLSVILAGFFSATITNRIKQLIRSMHKASLGNFTVQIPVESADELGRMAASFNHMIAQIKSLFEQIALTEKQKREAELKALHYQINPHLLYNTLNSIQWKARLNGQKEIDRMISHLVDVLQDSLNITQELVTLRRELTVIHHYMQIQKFRFGESFTYISGVDEELMDCLLPRMTLQPLMENIFFHGLIDGQGTIRLQIRQSGRELLIVLSDDGVGITEERMAQILKPPADRPSRKGLGMANVHEKIQLHFGETYGISLKSKPGMGTTVLIRCPIRKENVNGQHSSHDCG
ncbi:hypothetical protein PUR_43830 [Paenibacillus sp. URB8-2]|nr:hypothetical protein PUR_43830 [Paenibacillus sp. URB8-2]